MIDAPAVRPRITPLQLFIGFAHLGLVAFGGAITWARRLLVVERGWLTAAEFNEVIGLGQVLPGPNVVNASVVIGAREAGALGAAAALAGILLPPLAILIVLVTTLARFADVPIVQHALRGSALAGAGLIVATGAGMAGRLRGNVLGIGLAVAAFVLLVVVHTPLPLIVGILIPLGALGVVLRDRKRA
jgi:chromate transporter